MREDYSVTIVEVTKTDLSARERIMLKDMSNAVSIEEAVRENPLVIDYSFHAILDVHNEHSKNEKDYSKTVVVDKAGNKFVTGSKSFTDSLIEIVSEMLDAGETEFQIEVYTKPSKNYAGNFITCSLI